MPFLDVVLEVTSTRSFACALWFPGWFGYGKTPELAVERLLDYRPRYVPIAKMARRTLPSVSSLRVVEERVGNGTTQFGAPGQISDAELAVTERELVRLRALHAACREVFATVAASAPMTLRKGPRGGGRDTAKVIEHVEDTEKMYATRLRKGTWPEAYYLRRSGYHYTDHAWEVEDRSTA